MIAQTLPKLGESISHEDFCTEQIKERLEDNAHYLSALESHQNGFSSMIHMLSPKITLGVDRIKIHLELENVKRLLAQQPGRTASKRRANQEFPKIQMDIKAETITLTAEVNLKFSRGRTELVDAETGQVVTPSQSTPSSTLMQAIVQAEFWRQEMINNPSKSMSEVMKPYNVSPNYVRRLLNAAYLSPEIKKAIFQGTQPPALQVQDLTKKHPMDWQAQKKELGFA